MRLFAPHQPPQGLTAGALLAGALSVGVAFAFLPAHVKTFESMQQAQFSTRAADLIDIEKAILRNLLGGRGEPLHVVDGVVDGTDRMVEVVQR